MAIGRPFENIYYKGDTGMAKVSAVNKAIAALDAKIAELENAKAILVSVSAPDKAATPRKRRAAVTDVAASRVNTTI